MCLRAVLCVLGLVVTAAGCGGGSSSSGKGGAGFAAGTGVGGSSGGGAAGSAGPGGAAGTGASTGSGGGVATKRPWPDSTAKTLVLADQLPDALTAAQQMFVVTHMVGTQKLTRDKSQPLRVLK